MSARVLVVDDIPANVKLLEARLSAEYFDVVTAVSGVDALKICERAECDVVLLDVMMPDMDGFEVCKRLKSNPATHHIPVVMVTALDLARKHRPDLILMDIQLPEVSGLEVTKWLKEDQELRSIPVVAVTAFAMKGDEERIREGGCEAYLSKPISVGKFIETIRHFLGNA